MIERIKKLVNNNFVKNVVIMASGTAFAQIVTMILSPIITRLYGPEAYGLMGVFMAMAVIIAPISSLTFPTAIVLPKEDEEAKSIAKLSLLTSTIIALLSICIIIFFKDLVIKIFNLESVSNYLFLIPVVIMNAGILQVVEQWLIRKREFRSSAKATFSQAFTTNGGKVAIGFIYPKSSILIVFSALNEGIRAFFMLLYSKSLHLIRTSKMSLNIKEMKKIFVKYKDFPLYRAPQVFANSASQSLPVLMLTAFFGVGAVGFYSIGRTVLSIPSQLIGKSVGDVFYPRITEAANNKENLPAIIRKATLLMSLVGIIPYGLVFLFGPFLFSFVFGQEWLIAGEYARWLAIWIFFMFINQPSIKALLVLNAQRLHLVFTIVTLIARSLALFLGYYFFENELIAIALFSVSGAVLNILLIIFTLYLSKKHQDSI